MFVKWRSQNCTAELPSGVKDSLQPGGVRCAEELTQVHTDTHKHTHTCIKHHMHIHTQIQTHKHPWLHAHKHIHAHTAFHETLRHTHASYQQTLTITQQNSLRQCPTCVTVFSVDWLQEQQEVLKVKYWLRVGKEANRPSKKDLNLLHTNHSVSGATTGYLLSNNNTFPGKPAAARCWPLLTYRYWQDEEDMELCSD